MAIYQCIKGHLIPFYAFRDMLQTSFLLQKLRREVTLLVLVTGLWFLHSAIPLMGGQTDGYTDNQRDTIIPCHYRVAGYKKQNNKQIASAAVVISTLRVNI